VVKDVGEGGEALSHCRFEKTGKKGIGYWVYVSPFQHCRIQAILH
jgi:hypothetical protein